MKKTPGHENVAPGENASKAPKSRERPAHKTKRILLVDLLRLCMTCVSRGLSTNATVEQSHFSRD